MTDTKPNTPKTGSENSLLTSIRTIISTPEAQKALKEITEKGVATTTRVLSSSSPEYLATLSKKAAKTIISAATTRINLSDKKTESATREDTATTAVKTESKAPETDSCKKPSSTKTVTKTAHDSAVPPTTTTNQTHTKQIADLKPELPATQTEPSPKTTAADDDTAAVSTGYLPSLTSGVSSLFNGATGIVTGAATATAGLASKANISDTIGTIATGAADGSKWLARETGNSTMKVISENGIAGLANPPVFAAAIAKDVAIKLVSQTTSHVLDKQQPQPTTAEIRNKAIRMVAKQTLLMRLTKFMRKGLVKTLIAISFYLAQRIIFRVIRKKFSRKKTGK